MNFQSQHPHYEFLRTKWLAKQRSASEKFLSNHSESLRKMALGGLGSLMILTTPGISHSLPGKDVFADTEGITKTEDKNALLAKDLKEIVPEDMRKLTPDEENKIGNVLSKKLGMNVSAELQGIKLNRSYGVIGGEQHLYRFPGDNLYKHADNASDWAMYGPAGIAPGLGAWGYFASSESGFSELDKERERFYIAVQTFLAPGFSENVSKYRDFFKFRKMVLVNPKTGQSVVAVIGDAGPAEWTGKHLGGSPEVMHFLGLAGGPRKGPVLYYFVDDPGNKIPLGPVKIK